MPVATSAQAATSSWVQLGTASGPMFLQATSRAVQFAFAATTPATNAAGMNLEPGDVFYYTGFQDVYIKLCATVSKGGVTPGAAAIYSV